MIDRKTWDDHLRTRADEHVRTLIAQAREGTIGPLEDHLLWIEHGSRDPELLPGSVVELARVLRLLVEFKLLFGAVTLGSGNESAEKGHEDRRKTRSKPFIDSDDVPA